MGRIANGEGCSQPTTLTSCTKMETNETHINKDSTMSVISVAQTMSTYNKEYYQRRKEQTMMEKRRVYAFQEDPYDFVYKNILGRQNWHTPLFPHNCTNSSKGKSSWKNASEYTSKKGGNTFAVDTYIKIETTRLVFVEKNQTKIRANLYQGIVDCFNVGDAQPSRVGQRVVLPASFIGGPCDMRRRFMDAMALVQDDGMPDIFLTMTCNPKWKEIDDELLPGQSAQDRSNLMVRVFHVMLEDLKVQLLQRHIIGVVGSYVYVIEFQKHGLPHAHFL
ncbi:unnamed protein product [Lactuca saligna]|uniref:Helitron helicase-like domain-containing protein n=1 Tax=Lactuca saligna TaxID=75948 RepID=A0AA35Y7E7_LACSI|nr:unnamed protein product [Lactuca saligna]